ncbi:pyocin activator PrtN family protein [Endozoicomonas gorgoniicola]|uniref:Pyocin activator PrtN family protein n=1 Tax=Endozoicomonas gorgoniicola TaxID=1234144 RepID=A0ABT3MV84_9GAMM|nr:pyocin activator PrtN family protein [Endozoicomonas gorgoniicola]MCW7553285.1 pyocin activator PrtN family protein [Endozoicomonas gorgoniicola]
MNTELMLYAKYEKPYVRLEEVCDEFFGLCEKKAKAAAASQQLPVPVVRLTESRKSPMMIRLSDLASFLDSRHQTYSSTWEKVRGVR